MNTCATLFFWLAPGEVGNCPCGREFEEPSIDRECHCTRQMLCEGPTITIAAKQDDRIAFRTNVE
eukprot:1091865-Amphidinium_carterae.1